MAKKLQLGEVWADTMAILRSEFVVLAPIAVAFMGLASFLMAQIRPAIVMGQIQPGTWMILLLPLLLWSYFGSIAIATLVLEPNGPTVRDALRRALGRLGVVIRLFVLLMAAGTALLIPLSLLLGLILAYTPGGLAAAQAGQLPPAAIVLMLAALTGVILLLSRLLPI